MSPQKTKAVVAAPTAEDLAKAEQTSRLNRAMGALSDKDAALYRTIFAAQRDGDWAKADAQIAGLSDKRLLASVFADRFERRGASGPELAAWLRLFPDHAEAEAFYAKASHMKGVRALTKPKAPEIWSGSASIDRDGAADFTPDLTPAGANKNTEAARTARAIQKAIRKGNPQAARDVLIAAQNDRELAGTFSADAQAAIAEAFFRSGERDQAAALARAAAGANQPLGLWIAGLIAWENNDIETARTAFTRLSDHPALNDGNRAAATFWAYRAEAALGNTRQARAFLERTASTPRNFYGLMASQLLGRSAAAFGDGESRLRWNEHHRALLAALPSGWRALALVQVGQNARAEAELRRLNPLGSNAKQEAMQALARFVPMPALSLQLASLTPDERGFDPMAYPLLPWQPSGGFAVDRALLFALARHESLFDPQAVSTRGARGLMQIMPATAHTMVAADARLSALADDAKWSDPSFNMALGQKYVQHLASLPQIGNNLVLLLAAYNRGPAKVATWTQGKANEDPLLFLESIPVRETRNYIARVLPHYWAYRVKLGRPTRALRELALGKWPKAPLAENAKALRVAEIGKGL